MSIIEGIRSHYRLFGIRGVLAVAEARLSPRPLELKVEADGTTHPIHLRLRTTDVSIFESVILNSEYLFDPVNPPKTIIDAGANIGLTSVFYANRFPQARIIAIEPERANFEMLIRNTAYYPNVIPVHAALWSENVSLNLSDPGNGSWGFQTYAGETNNVAPKVRGMTVAALMKEYSIQYIDILKVDIEGAEKEVFESAGSWIDKVGAVIVELHDHTKDGCSRSVYRATGDFQLEWRTGETVFFVKKQEVSQLNNTRSLPTGLSADRAVGYSVLSPKWTRCDDEGSKR